MNADEPIVSFIGGQSGMWVVQRMVAVTGISLADVSRVAVHEGVHPEPDPGVSAWTLRGTVQPDHYIDATQRRALDEVSPPLGRRNSTCAALIPIRKSPAWWTMPVAARRAIFEERSHHVARSVAYLPRIARRLHHSRDLGEPFDFLTWFEFAPADEAAFDELVAVLRATEEWTYVDREVDIRLRRDGSV